MAGLTYLHIRGTLAENMVYSPRRGHESTRPGRRGEGDPAFELVLLDGNGRVLLSVTPQVTARGCGRAEDPLRFQVRGSLPLHPSGTAYELRRGEIRLYKTPVLPDPPKISAPRCRINKEGLALRWQSARRKGATYSIVALMESGRRFNITRDLTELTYTVDLSRIPAPGKGKLFIVANDGVRSSEVEAASIEVPSRPPTVYIIAPIADTRLPFGQPVSALGCCLDMGGEPCPSELAIWLLDGERFASGTWIAALDHPQPGIHKLTLEYGGGEGRIETSVMFEIEEPDANYRHWEEHMAEASPTTNLRGEY
jgi:hypothetical protein